jgi:ankyrin repeat protein
MKHTLLTLTIASLLATNAFADPIHDAAWDGDNAGILREINKRVPVNTKDENGKTALHIAAYVGHSEIVELLIAVGADVNAKDEDGSTPLLQAAEGTKLVEPKHGHNHAEIIKLLILNDADVNAKDKNGTTPLHYVAGEGHKEIAELLLTKGADVNAKSSWDDWDGWTPLHQAVEYGHKETTKLLIDAGADVNAKNDAGWTPLHRAAEWGHKEIVELLLTKDAYVNAKDSGGITPLDYAEDYPEIVTLLGKHGGKIGEELKALMPRLTYGRGLFDFSFNAKDGMTYVVEVTQDFKQWGELETIEGTGKQVKFTDPRQPLVPFKRNFYRVKVVE